MDSYQGFAISDLKNSISPDNFNLIIFPTEQCNFRCTYCYEDFLLGKMPDWLIDATKQFISTKAKKVNNLQLSWFGGEPLVAKNILFDITEHAFRECTENGTSLLGSLTTNGFLLDKRTLQSLVACNQKNFQISIDGSKEYHDMTRLTRNGRGSFDSIWRRILDALSTDLDFKMLLRFHVNAKNYHDLPEFIEQHHKDVFADKRINLFFKCIEDLGGVDNKDELAALGAGKLRETAKYLQESYQPKQNESKQICYASKPNSLGIRSNGDLVKCTVALNDEANAIGKINKDGTVTISQQKFSSWVQGFSTLDGWQLGCPQGFMKAKQKTSAKYSDSQPIDVVMVE